MQSATPERRGLRLLPFAPLKHAIDTWLEHRDHDVNGALTPAQIRAYWRATTCGDISLRLAEDYCDDFGWHPRELWGDGWDQLIRQPSPRRRRRRSTATANHNRHRTHCPQGHPYDQANTHIEIDSRGRKHRVCRTCKRERGRAAKRRKLQREWEAAA